MADLTAIRNQDLIQAFHMLQYDSTPERQADFMQEVVNAHFIAPVIFDPQPQEDEKGNLIFDQQAKITFPAVANKDGEKYFPAFTDWKEAQKWELKDGERLIGTAFVDYEGLVLEGQAAGFVINPFGENIRIEKKVIEELRKQQKIYMGMRRHEQAGRRPAGALEFRQLERYPEGLTRAVADLLRDQPVKAAYIQGVIQGTGRGVMFVLDQEEGCPDLTAQIVELARPYMKGMYLYVASLDSQAGQKAVQGLKPFYQR